MAYTGKQSFVLVGSESTFNSTVSPTKDLGIITSVDASLNNNINPIDGIGDRQAYDLLAGSFDGTVSFSGVLNSGAICEMFFGQATDTTTTGDTKHIFVDSSGTLTSTLNVASSINSYTISSNHDGATDVIFTYGGCKSNSITINLEVGGILSYDNETIVSSVITGTTIGTKVTTTTQPFIAAEATVQTGDEGSESSKCPISNFSLTFNNNIDTNDIRCIGSRLPEDLVVKKLEITGDFTAKFGTTTEAERFLGGSSVIDGTPTDTGIILEVTNGTTFGAGRRSFYVKLTGCQYESLGRSYSQDGLVEESYSFTAERVSQIYFDDQVASYF